MLKLGKTNFFHTDNSQPLLSIGLAIFLIALTLYRLAAISQGHVTLFYDEAYYYHWSLNPDWGYYSKPPMVAWVIALTTSIFGDTDFAVKLGAPLLYGATAWIIYLIGRQFWYPKAAVASALVFSAAPLTGFNSLFITTDAPLLFFWALSVWRFNIATHTKTWQDWTLLGIAVGLGMMSKYTMALLPIGLILYMLVNPGLRQQLTGLKPWAAALLAGAIFLPNIYWNYQHQFVTLSHTSEISQLDKQLFHPDMLAEFILSQLLVFGPIWSYFLFRQWFSKLARTSITHSGLLMAIFLPLFAVICTQALLSRAFINWAAPCLIAVSLWTGFYLSTFSFRKLYIGMGVQLFALALFYHWPQVLSVMGIEDSRKNDPYQRTLGWPEISKQLIPTLQAYPDAVITSPSRKLLAYVGFYATPGELNVARWNSDDSNIRDYYDLFFNLRKYDNQPEKAFLLINEVEITDEVLSRFDSCGTGQMFEYQALKDLTRTVYLYPCKGFKGYSNENR